MCLWLLAREHPKEARKSQESRHSQQLKKKSEILLLEHPGYEVRKVGMEGAIKDRIFDQGCTKPMRLL